MDRRWLSAALLVGFVAFILVRAYIDGGWGRVVGIIVIPLVLLIPLRVMGRYQSWRSDRRAIRRHQADQARREGF